MVLYALRSRNEVDSQLYRTFPTVAGTFYIKFSRAEIVPRCTPPATWKFTTPAATASAWNSFRSRISIAGARAQPAVINFPNLCCSPTLTLLARMQSRRAAAMCMLSVNRIGICTYIFCWVRCCGDNCVDSIFSCLLRTNAPFRILVCFGVVALKFYRCAVLGGDVVDGYVIFLTFFCHKLVGHRG